MPLRVLLLADTHLGFDLPARPRVKRRRRGDDFFANFRRALEPAIRGEVDLVVHGGDLLYRSKVRPWLVQLAFAPLLEAAERVPIFLVPGNHERSAIPFPMFGAHRNLHVFDRPRTFALEAAGLRVSLSGFPFQRDIAPRFAEVLEATGWNASPAQLRLLCMHQTVEGATVGPGNFTFRAGIDVIRGVQIPEGLDAVLSGHIHRTQVLTQDLAGNPMAAPVVYPGSIERTSRAERDEKKGYFLLELEPGTPVRRRFVELPARPMVDVALEAQPADIAGQIREQLARLDPDAVVRLKVEGAAVSEAMVRSLAPETMTVELDRPFEWAREEAAVDEAAEDEETEEPARPSRQLSLFGKG